MLQALLVFITLKKNCVRLIYLSAELFGLVLRSVSSGFASRSLSFENFVEETGDL